MAINNPCGDQVYCLSQNVDDYTYDQLKAMVIWLRQNHIAIRVVDHARGDFDIIFVTLEQQVLFQMTWGFDHVQHKQELSI